MANEKKTDIFISKLLESAKIKYTPNGSDIKEIQEALKTASKKGTGKSGFPEFVAICKKDFILVIEDKATLDKQVKYENDDNQTIATDQKSVTNYAENGALHYAKEIISKTNFKKIFAFGCSGDEKHHIIRPFFVDEKGYTLLEKVENFENFSDKNIEKYYKEQVLKETPQEAVELADILKKSAILHEMLRNYGQLGDSEKPLVVSALLLALSEKSFETDSLIGDELKTDGQRIYDALSTHMERVKVQPVVKKEKVLNQFNIIKDRSILSTYNDNLAKTPLKSFAEYIKNNILDAVLANTTEDVLGRFYGEFISYGGGDGQTLGVVLTPKHITELFSDLIDLKPTDKIFDPCCGTGGFLIAGMHKMLNKNDISEKEKDKIKTEQIHGIEIREDMFAIATTNMILRGDGKSNLINEDFLRQPAETLRKNNYTVGFINPPYSQAKGKDTAHLSEISFIKHLLDSLAEGGRCVAIIPQSTMVGKTKEDKAIKKQILQSHTLEGVITLNKNTFYGVGTNPCIAIFTAHKQHSDKKYCKFVNYEDDGFVISKHIGLLETQRATERKAYLLDCWLHDKPAETKFMVKTTIEPEDEWLHSFYYFNDEIPKEQDFDKTISDYLTFEFSMIMQGREYLFDNNQTNEKKKPEPTYKLENVSWKEFEIGKIFKVTTGNLISKNLLKKGQIARITATDNNNGIYDFYQKINDKNYRELSNFISVSFLGSVFYHSYSASLDMKIHAIQLPNKELNKFLAGFIVLCLKRTVSTFSYGDQLSSSDLPKKKILLPATPTGEPDYAFMEAFMREKEQEKLEKYITRKLLIINNLDRKSTRLNSSHLDLSRMPSSA